MIKYMPPITRHIDQAPRFDKYNEESGKKLIVYHTNWSNYGRNYQVKDLPIGKIDDVCYAFFNLTEKGDVISGDKWADFDKRYTDPTTGIEPVDSWNSSNPFYGNLGQFYKLKKKDEKFNLILSVGGWSWSKNFSSAVSPENRGNFVESLLRIFNDYPVFSGVSLDWEYCTDDGVNHGNEGNFAKPVDAYNFKEFCRLLREALNNDGKDHYIISTCCSANPILAKKLRIKDLSVWVDEFHIMTYDFMGFSGQKVTGHHTNLKKCSYCDFSVEEAVETYLEEGVNPQKLFIGVAFYSRGFKNSSGPGEPGEGGSLDTSWEQGIVDYKDLPIHGSKEYWDPNCLAPFSYDANRKVYNSYDNPSSVYEKCKYIWTNKLGGVIVWESSADNISHKDRNLISLLQQYLKTDPHTLDAPALPEVWGSKEPDIISEPITEPETEPIEWQKGKNYELHELVSYNGQVYKCIVSHTSNIGWVPDLATSLWVLVEKDTEEDTPREISPPQPPPSTPHPICDCVCKRIKSIKIIGDIDMSNVEISYEEDDEDGNDKEKEEQ